MNENDTFVSRAYQRFYNEEGYLPKYFNPYNCCEIKEVCPTLTTCCGSTTSSATVR